MLDSSSILHGRLLKSCYRSLIDYEQFIQAYISLLKTCFDLVMFNQFLDPNFHLKKQHFSLDLSSTVTSQNPILMYRNISVVPVAVNREVWRTRCPEAGVTAVGNEVRKQFMLVGVAV